MGLDFTGHLSHSFPQVKVNYNERLSTALKIGPTEIGAALVPLIYYSGVSILIYQGYSL